MTLLDDNNIARSLPIQVDALLSSVTRHVRDVLTGPLSSDVTRDDICLNLIYYNPRTGTTLNFMPFADDTRTPRIQVGQYYRTLRSLQPYRLTTSHVEELLAYAIRTPQAVAVADRYLRRFPHLGTTQEVLRTFIDAFATYDTAALEAFKDDLRTVVHCLLSFLPQPERLPYTAWNHKPRKDGSTWVTWEKKEGLWKKAARIRNPTYGLYFLLSAAECLQWADEHSFGIIPNVYEFLAKWIARQNEPDRKAKRYQEILQYYSIPLRRVGLYFTYDAPKSAETERVFQRQTIEALAQILFRSAGALVQLVSAAAMCSSQLYGPLDSPAQSHSRLCLGLLSLLKPKRFAKISSAGGDDTPESFVRRALPRDWHKQTELHTFCLPTPSHPWGRYQPASDARGLDAYITDTSTIETSVNGQYLVLGEHLFRGAFGPLVMYFSADDAIWLDVRNGHGREFLGQFVNALRAGLPHLPSDGGEWYLSFFDAKYYDSQAQFVTQCQKGDLGLRRHRDINLIKRVFKQAREQIAASLRILIIGCGCAEVMDGIQNEHTDSWWVSELSPNVGPPRAHAIMTMPSSLGDLCHSVQGGEFDLVVALSAVLGFGTEEANQELLRRLCEVVAPGGWLLSEHPGGDVHDHPHCILTSPHDALLFAAQVGYENHEEEWPCWRGVFHHCEAGRSIERRYRIMLYDDLWLGRHVPSNFTFIEPTIEGNEAIAYHARRRRMPVDVVDKAVASMNGLIALANRSEGPTGLKGLKGLDALDPGRAGVIAKTATRADCAFVLTCAAQQDAFFSNDEGHRAEPLLEIRGKWSVL